ncbi:hypothetical protein [Tomitella gaofuii]|uniref:hypothetical protein n=1 Tax=Tomitella gaofuii TaxID=2760083 RepID=UPI0015FA532B|nr:hypothetical protein [Tomitella gaofuii]
MSKHTFPLAVVAVSALVLTACGSNAPDGADQAIADAQDHGQQVASSIQQPTSPPAADTGLHEQPLTENFGITGPDGQPAVEGYITSLTLTDSCTMYSGPQHADPGKKFLTVEYDITTSPTLPDYAQTGFGGGTWHTISTDGYTEDVAFAAYCDENDGPDLTRLTPGEKVRGAKVLVVNEDAAQFTIQPKFGLEHQMTFTGWAWNIPR